jgi:hypothetical protein
MRKMGFWSLKMEKDTKIYEIIIGGEVVEE